MFSLPGKRGSLLNATKGLRLARRSERAGAWASEWEAEMAGELAKISCYSRRYLAPLVAVRGPPVAFTEMQRQDMPPCATPA